MVYVVCVMYYDIIYKVKDAKYNHYLHIFTQASQHSNHRVSTFTLNKNQGLHYYFTFVDSSYFELTLLSTTTPLPRRLNICIELIKISTRPPVVVNRASSLSSWALLLKVSSRSG